jgi:hypothetical protein
VSGILPDVNVQGHFDRVLDLWREQALLELWNELGQPLVTFEDLGLSRAATDAEVWAVCQRAEVVLLTANRKDEGPTSLEATIRQQNTPTSLPVLTIADANRFMHDRAYADRVAGRLLDYLADLDNLRGAGRLYLP